MSSRFWSQRSRAPSTFFGQEVIELTATDTGGLTDTTLLAVIVQEVVAPLPGPDDKCGEVTITLTEDEAERRFPLVLGPTYRLSLDSPAGLRPHCTARRQAV